MTVIEIFGCAWNYFVIEYIAATRDAHISGMTLK